MYTLHYGDKRAHYLAMPRTASKATRDAFKEVGGVIVGGHHTIEEYQSTVREGDLVMSTVRNHWDWFVSFWYLNGCPGRFDRFVPRLWRESEWVDRRNPTCMGCRLYWKYSPYSTVILRYERLQECLDETMEAHGFPSLKLRQNDVSKRKPYQTYYKKPLADRLYSVFKEEIDYYGYKF